MEPTRPVSLQRLLTLYARALLRQHAPAPNTHDLTQPGGYDVRDRFHREHGHVRRLVIFTRGSQCEWASRSGGCVYCGFFTATNGGVPVAAEDLLAQISAARNEYLRVDADCVSIYNDGSFLNPEEVADDVQLEVLRRVATWPGIKSITVETRPKYIVQSRLDAYASAVGACQLEISVGFDSTSEHVQHSITNRGIAVRPTIDRMLLVREVGFQVCALMVYKLPFMTEHEALEDMRSSIVDLHRLGIPVDIEAMTVQVGSITELLHREGLYRVPWIWSIVELLRSVPDPTMVHLSPFLYSVPTRDIPRNCPTCTEGVVRQLFQRFEFTRDPADLPNVLGCCADEWRRSLAERPAGDLTARAHRMLGMIQHHLPDGWDQPRH